VEAAEGTNTLDNLQIPGAQAAALTDFYANQSGLLTSFIQSSAYLSSNNWRPTFSVDIHPTLLIRQYKVPICTSNSNSKGLTERSSRHHSCSFSRRRSPLPTAPGVAHRGPRNFFSASSFSATLPAAPSTSLQDPHTTHNRLRLPLHHLDLKY